MESKNNSTQNFVPIKEVKDGVIILKDGSMRAILMASATNFALKSSDEQKSIIYQFQNFLNSINFDIQIFVQSRRLDIRPYINILEQREKEQINDLMRIQTREYIQFIKTFTEQSNIMTKRFFITIPYTPPVLESVDKKSILGLFKKKDEKKDFVNFDEYKYQLQQRIEVVAQGITRTGVRVVQLGTEEIIEVFYQLFNPSEFEKVLNINN